MDGRGAGGNGNLQGWTRSGLRIPQLVICIGKGRSSFNRARAEAAEEITPEEEGEAGEGEEKEGDSADGVEEGAEPAGVLAGVEGELPVEEA